MVRSCSMLQMRGAAMSTLIRCVVLAAVMLPLAKIASASDALYRCADGTFTNRVERQCPPYASKDIVRVEGGTAEASKQPFAEVKLFDERGKTNTEGTVSKQ